MALAVGQTVHDSFLIGREAVAASPYTDAQRALTESGKFLLLPEPSGPTDKRHHVPIFGPTAARVPRPTVQLAAALSKGPVGHTHTHPVPSDPPPPPLAREAPCFFSFVGFL